MPDIIRANQPPVPAEFADELRRLYATNPDRLNSVLLAARLNGWNLRTLGDALGITGEAVRVRVAQAAEPADDPPSIPPVPRRAEPLPKVRRLRLELNPEQADELRRMHQVARRVNGGMPAEHPDRRVSEQLTALLDGYVRQGVAVYHLAQVLGITFGAVSFRLARHGYRKHPPSLMGRRDQTYKNRKVGDVRAAGGGRG